MDYKSRIKDVIKKGVEYQDGIITGLAFVLIFFLGLGIGLLIRQPKTNPIIIDKNIKIGLPAGSQSLSSDAVDNFIGGNFVASINGKAYYPKGCKSANVIKEENRVWFENAGEAEADGYTLAKNCP